MDISFLSRDEINQLIIEYLVIEGYKDAAEKFASEIGISQENIKDQLHSETLADRMDLRQSVIDKKIEETIAKINEIWPNLFEKSPYIYYQLRQLQMLELIKEKKIEEALNFAQTHLSDLVQKCSENHPHLLTEMENTMALLAFENPHESVYGSLLSDKHVEMVAGTLNREILQHIQGDEEQDGKCQSVYRNYGITTTVPRLTKMMSFLLYLQDQSQLDIPKELTNLD